MDGNLLRFNKKAKIAFIDAETFNLSLNFQFNRPWQLAVIMCQGGVIIEELDLMIKWDDCKFSIGKGAAEITKFNKIEFDKRAITPEEAFPQIWAKLKEADYIVVHNGLRFDIYLLKGFAEWMGEDWSFILPKIIDTKSVAQGIKLNRPFNPVDDNWLEYQYRMANDYTKGVKTSLSTLGKEFGIEHDYANLHNALIDLRLNVKVFYKLIYQVEI